MIQKKQDDFQYAVEQFADLGILRYNVPGFEKLTLQQKELLYYLYEAALAGRDIVWDQNYKYNLTIRKTLEAIISSYQGDKTSDNYKKFLVYTKRVWFSNGIHHHYSNDKILPEFSEEYFLKLVQESDASLLPLKEDETENTFIKHLTSIIFDPKIAAKKVNLDTSQDMILNSAVNFYEGITQDEATSFYEKLIDKDSKTPIMIGLNSKLVKENNTVVEKVWKVDGMYTEAIEHIVFWLEKAITVSESAEQKNALEKLVKYYRTGSLVDFDEYNIAWVEDKSGNIDVTNGFIETYDDPLNKKGTYESVVSVKDFDASERIESIGANAQWFEDHSPILSEHKKKNVKGISAKAINVVIGAGATTPSSPIGINLPNNEWIRETHGSKSVNLENIVNAYDKSSGGRILNEFYYDDSVKENIKKCGDLADKLHTDMHEVIGHASGKIEAGVAPSDETLKNYAATLEEGRADLVALYYLMDQKLVELGVMPGLESGKAAYDEYITNGLIVQMARLKLGDNVEEAHMRNRQMIAAWVYEKGKSENIVEKKMKDGKTYFVVNDYDKLRTLFGTLLKEVQRIKSQGDYNAGKALVETYGVKVNKALHQEVLNRYSKLNLAPYKGFIQPKLIPIFAKGTLKDVSIEYPKDFSEQMMYYGKHYSFLPINN